MIPRDARKIILFSMLISLNIVIWHEIIGPRFVMIVIIIVVFLILCD